MAIIKIGALIFDCDQTIIILIAENKRICESKTNKNNFFVSCRKLKKKMLTLSENNSHDMTFQNQTYVYILT